jgi:membrane-associated protein
MPMSEWITHLLDLHGLVVYAIVGLLVFAEDAVFVGFVVPGETAAILGGVAASRGHVNVAVLCTVVVAAAVLGDNIGYAIGARWGDRAIHIRLLRRRTRQLDRAGDLLARRGGPAVVIGRLIAFLRAIVPFLAGTSHMRYGKFLAYNAAGGLVWGVGSVLLGYLAGDSYRAIERALGPATAIAFAVVVIGGVIGWRIYRHRQERADERQPARGVTLT